MAAGGEQAAEEGEVADPAVRRQVVEAPRVVDQVVRAGEAGRVGGEGVAQVEADRGAGRAGAFAGPVEGGRRQVDGVDPVPLGGQEQGVAAGSAAQVEGIGR